MRLSQNFTLAECVKSDTAERLGLDNTPDAETIERMKAVCTNILEAARHTYGRPVMVRSFYRSPDVNAAVGSKPNSQHVSGEAVDFEIPGVPNDELARWVRDRLTFDQCILEFYKPGVPDSGWVHVSYKDGPCRKECLTVSAGGTVKGLPVQIHPFS